MAGSIRNGSSLAALLLLAGCVSLGGKVPRQLIALTARNIAPAGTMAGGQVGDTLVVLDPDADRRIDVQRVPVQIDESTVAYLKDATWIERPTHQFRRLLAETIRARGKRMVAEGSDLDGRGHATLSGRLLDMGYDARSQSVVVRYDAIRRDDAGAIQSRRFEAVVPGVAPNVRAVAPALNTAANDVAVQVADWIG
ncbi:MAG: ABC-type transport auxiliary lipoprotein family protein [Novosphingobium sp.]|nr:ABC-type transport auxiliary lipoprotein family protein [Novosphingobium sp.]